MLNDTSRCKHAYPRLRIVPRGLSRTEAAAYIGVSPSLFDAMVKDGRMPQPTAINSRRVWDRLKLDRAFEALDDTLETNPWDDI
jgi:predicted DNA-binding transcriptional regulator AlpA